MYKSALPKPLPCCSTGGENHGLQPSKLLIKTSIQNKYAECTVLICHLFAFNCEGTIHCDLRKLGAYKCCMNHRPACDRMTKRMTILHARTRKQKLQSTQERKAQFRRVHTLMHGHQGMAVPSKQDPQPTALQHRSRMQSAIFNKFNAIL